MGSQPKGVLRVLAWFDSVSDELKALINDDGRMPVSIDEQNVDLTTQLQVYGGTAWVKSPVIWGYTNRWAEATNTTSTGGGTTVVTSTPVPEGYVYVLEHYMCYHDDPVERPLVIEGTDGSINLTFKTEAALATSAPSFGKHRLTLKQDDFIRVIVWGLATGKIIYLRVWGYMMKVDM